MTGDAISPVCFKTYYMWKEPIDETIDEGFWICYHAAMLFFHGVITKETFNSIYNRYKDI